MNANTTIPFTIGLTGGIGSGKSSVSDFFAELGVSVIDTDHLSRELVEHGSPLLNKISEHFGEAILLSSGDLDRKKLRQIIFSNADDKLWLEQLLHPAIRELLLSKLSNCSDAYAIIVVPLLFENKNNSYSFLNRVLVVDCPEALQLERVKARDQSNLAETKKIIESQISRSKRLSLADDIIVNEASLESLKENVLKLHEKYKQLSHE